MDLKIAGRTAAYQLLPAFVQTEGEAPGRRQANQALSASGNALRTSVTHPGLDEAFKRKLREIYRTLDPVTLLAQMREAQNELGKRVDQRAGMPGIGVAPVHGGNLVSFARELGDGWKQGEQRIIHRRRYVRRKPVPRRPSMLDPYTPMIEEWLAAAPHLSAVDILSRSAHVRSARQLKAAYGATV